MRVTTNDTVLVHMLTGVFAAFRKTYPEIVLDVVVSNQALNLSKRDADVAVRELGRPVEAMTVNPRWASSTTATEPTPPAAPVTITGPCCGATP